VSGNVVGYAVLALGFSAAHNVGASQPAIGAGYALISAWTARRPAMEPLTR